MADGSPNRIIAAALRTKDGQVWSLPPPARHPDVTQHVFDTCADAMVSGSAAEGFVDDEGRFLLRADAAVVAFDSGQITTLKGTLYSEDLW